jgi:hypothetical protein
MYNKVSKYLSMDLNGPEKYYVTTSASGLVALMQDQEEGMLKYQI